MTKINFKKINFFLIVRYLYPITITVIIVILFFLMQFLYHNVYQTIIEAELITDLRKETSEENLEKNKFDQVITKLNLKSLADKLDANSLKDPFQNLSTPIIPIIPLTPQP